DVVFAQRTHAIEVDGGGCVFTWRALRPPFPFRASFTGRSLLALRALGPLGAGLTVFARRSRLPVLPRLALEATGSRFPVLAVTAGRSRLSSGAFVSWNHFDHGVAAHVFNLLLQDLRGLPQLLVLIGYLPNLDKDGGEQRSDQDN